MPAQPNPPRIRQLNGFTRTDRFQCVALIRDAILANRGWVTGFHEFSNLSICIEFEMPEAWLPVFAESLMGAGVTLHAESGQAVVNPESETAAEAVDCTLQVLFIHNEPDLRRTVAAVPG